MQREFGLHDLAVEDARHGHQRPKVEELRHPFRRPAHGRGRWRRRARRRRGRCPSSVCNNREYFRDVFDHLMRMNSPLDSLRDTIGAAIQVNLSNVTIEETEITKPLAAWTGIFAVATASAGIWGMNFQNLPELKLPWGHPAALTIITVDCSFTWWRFRKAKWL